MGLSSGASRPSETNMSVHPAMLPEGTPQRRGVCATFAANCELESRRPALEHQCLSSVRVSLQAPHVSDRHSTQPPFDRDLSSQVQR